MAGSSIRPERNRPSQQRGEKQARTQKDLRDMPALDRIHTIFLLYSGAHNTLNAWNRAENILFFLFVVVGILSVELMLWAIYKHWKEGRLVGKMLTIGKIAGFVALFYATAGILAEAQSTEMSGWLLAYYKWILPSSAPVMFFFAFWIQSADPIMTMERDMIAARHAVDIETQRIDLDTQRLWIKQHRTKREAEYALVSRQWDAISRHIHSVRTGWRLNGKAKAEVRNAVRDIEAKFEVGDMQRNLLSNPPPALSIGGSPGGDGQGGTEPPFTEG